MLRGLALVGLFVLSMASARAQDALTVGLNDTGSHPYIEGQGSDLADPPGLAVELMREAAERVGVDVRFLRMPGLRVLAELKSGRLDGALMFSYSPEREAAGRYPTRDGRPDPQRRLASMTYTLYRPHGSALDWTGHRFRHLDGRIAANLNYSIVADLQKLGVDAIQVRSTAEGFRMLAAGRVAGVADHETVADEYLARSGTTGVEKVAVPLRRKDYYLMVSHQFAARHPEVAEAVWDAIGELREPVTQSALPGYLDRQ